MEGAAVYDITSRIDGTWAEVSVWLPVAPAVAFDAVATGEGISSWFVTCALEPHVGGRIVQFADPGAPDPTTGPEAAAEASLSATVGEITGYDPAAGRFAYAERGWMGDQVPVPDWITEFTATAEDSGPEAGTRLVLRSGFEQGGPLVEEMLAGSVTGWSDALTVLAHRMVHRPDAGVVGVAAATEPRAGAVTDVWEAATRTLLAPGREGHDARTPEVGAAGSREGRVARLGDVGGVVIAETEVSLTFVLSSPHDGVCQVYAFPAGESAEDAREHVALAVRIHEYVDGPGGALGAAAVDGRPTWEAERWREWLDGLLA